MIINLIKEDLKTGIFVKLRRGLLGVIIYDDIVLQNGNYLPLDHYDSAFKYYNFSNNNKTYDIIEVRSVDKNHYQFSSFDHMCLEYKEKQFTKTDIQDGDVAKVRFQTGDEPVMKIYYVYNKLLLPCDRIFTTLAIDDFNDDLLSNKIDMRIEKIYRPCRAYQYDYLSESEIVYEREK